MRGTEGLIDFSTTKGHYPLVIGLMSEFSDRETKKIMGRLTKVPSIWSQVVFQCQMKESLKTQDLQGYWSPRFLNVAFIFCNNEVESQKTVP